MAYSGKYRPKHPEKYKGDPTNIVFRSSWEYSFMKRLDLDSSVVQWSSEEVIIPYINALDRKTHRYFVDFWVKERTPQGTREYLVEIKPKGQTEEPKVPKKKTKRYYSEVATYIQNTSKWKAANKYAKDRGMDFIILTEEELFGK